MSTNFKQFKLINGDEIVTDVIDSEDDILIVRASMKIVELENMHEGFTYFSLRPFIAFQDNLDTLQLLNTASIVLESSPSPSIMKHYANAVTKMNKFLKDGKTLEDLEAMTDDEIRKYMENLLDKYGEDISKDIDMRVDEEKEKLGPNVINFKPKDTMH